MDNDWPEYIWVVQKHGIKHVETDPKRVAYLESLKYEVAKYTILVPRGTWPPDKKGDDTSLYPELKPHDP